MSILGGLKPEKVFEYFEKICSIPHGSGETTLISEYIADFAIKHGLEYIQDASNNVIIYNQELFLRLRQFCIFSYF